MKIMLFWAIYEKYLKSTYKKNPVLYALSYKEQLDFILSDTVGWNIALAKRLEKQGHEVEILIVNAQCLQRAWAIENDCVFDKHWRDTIPMNQVKKFLPDILWVASIFRYFGNYLGEIKPYCKKILAWTACPMPRSLDLTHIDCVLTSHSNFQSLFKEQGLASEILLPSFEPNILDNIHIDERDIECSFVGSLSSAHFERVKIIKTLTKFTPIEVWSEPPNLFSKGVFELSFWSTYLRFQSIKNKIHPSVWGVDMYKILARSKISINVHIGVASGLAGNMRMFEVTGMGALLITEETPNINQLYKPGTEVITYKNTQDLIDIVNYYMINTKEREAIARAGQKKTLENHNSQVRSQELLEILNHYLD
jgi:spore maturation protein CgeB